MTDKITAAISRQTERYGVALAVWEGSYATYYGKPATMTRAEACEEMRKAGSRLYNLRRQLARASEAAQ